MKELSNKYGKNRPKIVIIEPEQADGILLSFQNNRISTSMGNSNTIMAGLNCETPSLTAWDLLKNGADYSIKISDEYAKQAMRVLYNPIGNDKRVISGESGASGFAGFLAILHEKEFETIRNDLNLQKDTNILFINTEGDTDKEVFKQIVHNTEKNTSIHQE